MKGLSAVQARLTALPARVNSAAQSALRETAAAAQARAQAEAPVRTGALRSSITVRQETRKAIVAARTPYAAVAERRTPYLAPAARQADFPRRSLQALKEAIK